jgi:hypothetical protein
MEASMAGIRVFNLHRPWEDWLSMLLGVIIGLSPWLADQKTDPTVIWNAILVGACVLVFAQLEYVSLQRWEEWCEIALGLWLVASPFALGYGVSGTLAYWHYFLGAAVALLAVLELWQDWKLDDKELATHGNGAR